ncbi:MAG: 6-phosphofructokinase [Clostridia bacterium]|jgi:6-phosphofructokinase 1|nr:6-phosphofructokinase [Clostridia bacterium]MCI2015273.1 6-phosphofructokinase [Clostridia bacterium]
MKKANCLVAQSGGPTAAINATLAGIYEAALKNDAIDGIFGGLYGIGGIIHGKTVDLKNILKDENIKRLRTTPSSFLGSCRYKLKYPDIAPDDYKKIFELFKRLNIKYFLYIGGNDSMDTILKLNAYQSKFSDDEKVMLVGVPKTIDNDLRCVDHTPGFGSAAKYIATTIKEIAWDTAVYDMNSILVAEVMGRNAGWLALSAGLARDTKGRCVSDLIYIPENPFDFGKLIDDIKKIQKNKKQIVITVSEGIRYSDGTLVAQSGKKDVFGHGQLGGAAKTVAEYIKLKLGVKVRAVEINVLQRCAAHCLSKTDIDESVLIGKKAVEVAAEGKTGVMITGKRTSGDIYSQELGYENIELIANLEKTVPENFMNREKNGVSEEGLKYLLPLVEGEINVEYKEGTPVYIKLDDFCDSL